ncbi:MAG: alanine racemase [Actinomycetota bacterium]|nr:alanine racemase [Actinomycetota bacterium]
MILRPVWAEVDLAAIRHNVGALAALAAPARLCAVVKAGAYGHGPVEAARAALESGATWLAVALVEEGAQLRDAGIGAPVLVLSEPPAWAMADVVGLGLTPTVYTEAGVAAAAAAVAAAGAATAAAGGSPLPVHVKVDTGMHRVGAAPSDAVKLALTVETTPELELQGVWTHLAVADAPDDPFTDVQIARFVAVLDELAGLGVHPPLAHACNSAGLLAHPAARHDLVRCGLTIYGVAPSPALADLSRTLRPALTLKARVSLVKEVGAGEGVSYGLRFRAERPTVVATVPVGYADGVPWRLTGAGGEVLIGGRRRPLAGAVTMDQIMVDCGPSGEGGRSVAVGDEVVLLGRQGSEEIGAWEWAGRLGTIAYEVLSGIGARVPRVHR